MRIVFMGTPDFSVPALKALIDSRHQVVAVVTQQDKPKGRGNHLQPTPVKEAALEAGIPVYQPEKARDPEFCEILASLDADVFAVAAYGQILSQKVLDIPRYGCLNIHASLLPKYRGASPIQWAILNGDEKTGVSIMKMEKGVDTGAVYRTAEYPLNGTETGGSLFDALSQLGGPLLLQVLDEIEAGTASAVPQDETKATHVHMLTKQMGEMDWSRSAHTLECQVRGLNPWPAAYTFLDGKMLKIWAAEVVPENSGECPGTVTAVQKDSFQVQTGDGQLLLTEVQLEGKKRMECSAFLRGVDLSVGTGLGKAAETEKETD